MISIRFYNRGSETLLAACDEELLEKTFQGNGMKITVSKNFYCSEIVTEETFRSFTAKATYLNLVGTRTINIAKDLGLVSDDGIIQIGDVTHAQVVRM